MSNITADMGDMIEFGSTVMLPNGVAADHESVRHVLDNKIESIKFALDYIKDIEYSDVSYVESPRIDPLDRFHMVGFHFTAKSHGLKAVQNIFKCDKEHVPYTITMDYIQKIIERYAEQQERDDYDGDIYD